MVGARKFIVVESVANQITTSEAVQNYMVVKISPTEV